MISMRRAFVLSRDLFDNLATFTAWSESVFVVYCHPLNNIDELLVLSNCPCGLMQRHDLAICMLLIFSSDNVFVNLHAGVMCKWRCHKYVLLSDCEARVICIETEYDAGKLSENWALNKLLLLKAKA